AVEGSVTNENNNLADSIASLEGDELGIPTPSLPPMNLPPLANNTSPEVTKEMKEKYEPEFAFSCFVPIHPTVRAGYKTPPSPAEWKAISEMKAGIGYTPRGQYYGKVSRQKMVNAFHGEEKRGVEHLLTLECKCAACRCLKKICRIDGGILCYENIDLSSGEPFEHTGHEISKEEQKKFRNPNQAGGNSRKQATKSKYDELSLTEIHHEFIRTFGMGEVSKGSWYDLAEPSQSNPTLVCLQHRRDKGPNAIIILFKGQCGAEIFMKMKRTAKMRKAFSAYASTKGVRMEDIRFLLQGNNLLDDWDRNGDLYDETPESLELHNNDQIDCMLIQRGC
ncbi:hypothetical protein ACHAXM_002311, partial [Skeletonema potamos]